MWYMVNALAIIAPILCQSGKFPLFCFIVSCYYEHMTESEKLYGLVMQDSVVSIQFIIL